MKNNFDFIKDKVDHSGVNAPEDMGESYALEKLADVQPKPVEISAADGIHQSSAAPNKPKRRWKTVAITAASIVLVAAISLAVVFGTQIGKIVAKPETPENTDIRGEKLTLSGGLSLVRFTDRSEVEDAVSKLLSARKSRMTYDESVDLFEYAADGSMNGSSASASGSTGGASPSHSETYKQVEGVDEADIIKTDGRYIYTAARYSEACIEIFEPKEGVNPPILSLNVGTEDTATPDESEDTPYDYYYYRTFYINDFYLKDNRLVVMCNDDRYNENMTSVFVYDITDIDRITLLDSFSQSGYYTSSRMIGDTLYTVSSYYPYSGRLIPCCGNTEETEEIPADCIYSYEKPNQESFLVVSAYDTVDYSAQTASKAILGAADDIYCNEDHLFIYAADYGNARNYSVSDTASRILKVDLTDGLSFSAYAEVKGVIDDQYALDEKNGYLRVATTSYDNIDVNNLFILDESLNTVGSVTGFARGESIKAVRYVGDTAYVITYEQTDPLFVIDLSDPTDPAILGEVKITGFSTMLVPIDTDTLLGIGYHTQEEDYTDLEVTEGVKLALFDVSDPVNPQVLDSISYENCESEVTYEPKALVYNPDRNDYIIPLNYHHYGYVYDEYGGYYDGSKDEHYGGMLNFKVDSGKIVPITRYRADHEDDVYRCIYIGDTVYMLCSGYDGSTLESTKYQ